MSTVDVRATEQALEAARQCDKAWWEWWGAIGYDRHSDRLVFHGELQPTGIRKGFWGRWDRWSKRGDDAYLVFRAPRYVRLSQVRLVSPKPATAVALEALRASLPACIPIDDLCVVIPDIEDDDLANYCIVCESVGFYRSDWREPHSRAAGDPKNSEPRHRVSLSVPKVSGDHPTRPRDDTGLADHHIFTQQAFFDEIEGATLEWGGIHTSHMCLYLVATGLPTERRVLKFSSTAYLDIPTTMHRVELRMATVAESAALPSHVHRWLVPPPGSDDCAEDDQIWLKHGHVIVQCDEGVFSIVAWFLLLSWRDASVDGLTLTLPDPLWRGGPIWDDL
jgi:hypothetical protein